MTNNFSVSTFKAQVSNTGFVQTNKYNVFITPTSNVGSMFVSSPNITKSFSQMGNDLLYRCVSASLPGIILRTADNNRTGTGVLEKMPFSGLYTDIDLSFMCDRQGAAYMFWYSWLNYIFASVGRDASGVVDRTTRGTTTQSGLRDYYTLQYKDNYSAIVDVIVFDNFGSPAIEYKLYECFPISINDSQLSWADNNNLIKITVKLTFREWAMNEGNVLLQTSQNS